MATKMNLKLHPQNNKLARLTIIKMAMIKVYKNGRNKN